MCGIAGYLSATAKIESSQSLAAMSGAIGHRGPDDEGFVFADIAQGSAATFSSTRSPSDIRQTLPNLPDNGPVQPHHVGISHVRYSIIDLSTGGHQPMWNECGTVCVSFNGEVYNYIELREELSRAGHLFRTSSDTEVLLAGYQAWGEAVFARINGFFAVAILDLNKKSVLLARDRLGKAHLYYFHRPGEAVYWASEIKSLFAAGCSDRSRIDDAAVSDFILYNRRDREGTFWEEIKDFPPAHFVWLDLQGSFNPQRYWGLPGQRWKTTDLSATEASQGLQDILADALRIRMRADVPIGFELSGGMDSSALVGLAAGKLGARLTSYTIEFPEAHSNEEPFARAVAGKYPDRIDYRVIQQPKDHFWQEADQFVWLQEEPFHAPNLHTNQYLRRLIKQTGAHVVITGAAGDEMLAGYAGDYFGPYLRHLLANKDLRTLFHEIRSNSEISLYRSVVGLLLDAFLNEEAKVMLNKRRSGEYSLLRRVVAPRLLLTSPRLPSTRAEKTFHGLTLANMSYRLMNYWLRSAAKADYGIPIESRAPFLDYRVVEYCCQLPPEYLIHDGWHKHVLRMAVREFIPEEVAWRRQKMGFPFPYREWLSANRLVAERNARGIACPFVDTQALFAAYEDFVRVAPVTLWRILSVLLWWRRVIEGQPIVFAP